MEEKKLTTHKLAFHALAQQILVCVAKKGEVIILRKEWYCGLIYYLWLNQSTTSLAGHFRPINFCLDVKELTIIEMHYQSKKNAQTNAQTNLPHNNPRKMHKQCIANTMFQ